MHFLAVGDSLYTYADAYIMILFVVDSSTYSDAIQRECEEMMAKLDVNKDGKMDYSEYLVGTYILPGILHSHHWPWPLK